MSATRDEHVRLPISAALEKGYSYRTKIEFDVRLFFGDEKAPPVAKRIGNLSANTRSNLVGKSSQEACDIAFISAVADLQQKARKQGGNAVINIRSVYGAANSASQSEYVCGAGTIMVGVTLEGTVVKLK
jgi:uncharacterized protein YbjQ (UPF0145 family)